MDCSMPGFPVFHHLPESVQTHVHWVTDAILCCPLLLLPLTFPRMRVFSNESALHITWPKYWSFSFNISSSNEHTGLISFRMDWLNLLEVQGTLKNLLQHHSSKASIFSALSFLYNFPGGSDGKVSAYNAGDLGSIPGLGRSPGEGNGTPLQYSCLENPMDCSLPGSSVHGVARVRHNLVTKPTTTTSMF